MNRWLDEIRVDPERLLRAHRLYGLVADSARAPEESHATNEARKIAQEMAVDFALHDLALSSMLREVIKTLSDAKIEVLPFKGGAFAEWLYSSSHHRPRLDLDVICRGWSGVEAAVDALRAVGFRRVHQLPGRLSGHAVAMASREGLSIDLHARVNRRYRLSQLLPVEALFERSWEVGRDVRFRTLCPADAMLVSLTHGATHHGGQLPPAIWREDQSRLAARMDDDAWRFVLECVEAADFRTVVRESLGRLIEWSPDAVPAFVVGRRAGWEEDASKVLLSSSHASRVLDDLEHLSPMEWGKYLGEIVFPPRSYMVEEYGVAGDGVLPAMWAHRLLRGLL